MNYKAFLYLYLGGSVISLIIFAGACQIPSSATFLIGAAIIGIFSVPLTPLMFEIGIELTYPVGESVTVGV